MLVCSRTLTPASHNILWSPEHYLPTPRFRELPLLLLSSALMFRASKKSQVKWLHFTCWVGLKYVRCSFGYPLSSVEPQVCWYAVRSGCLTCCLAGAWLRGTSAASFQ